MTRDVAMARLVAAEPDIRAPGVARLALFGSVARDEVRPDSDVDLLVRSAHLGRSAGCPSSRVTTFGTSCWRLSTSSAKRPAFRLKRLSQIKRCVGPSFAVWKSSERPRRRCRVDLRTRRRTERIEPLLFLVT
ncbi:MAG: nucleotidyltransferase domain-containing protein [Acidobacteria bacterium]|nr:nucleotidyltransferase domain-containing protein [Acidobacteriota bacterium]